MLCKYRRVMLRGRAQTVESGRVRQWSNQRLHEHWRQIHSRWPSIETCTCLKGSRAQRSCTRLFGRMGFSRSSWHSLRRGMRLSNHVKFQCGEIRKFDWCCEILSEAGAPCGSRFQSKRAFRCHQLRSNLHGHGRQTSVFSSVITNYCPWSTFSTTLIARKHAAASMLFGHCRVDAGAFPWPISPPKSLQCSLCDGETVHTSIDELYDHSVAVQLPKPSPVSLPIASVAKSFSVSIDASNARWNNAGSGGCPDGGRREETQTDSAQVGVWRTWFSNAEQ